MKKLMLAVAVLLSFGPKPAYALNVWDDFKQNLQWKIGEVASVGTAINLKNGKLSVSELAQVNEYRFLSTWYGLTQVRNESNTSFTMTDSFKLGFNVGYFFRNFSNKPPKVVNNLVIGPSISCPIFSQLETKRPVDFFLDANYKFGGDN